MHYSAHFAFPAALQQLIKMQQNKSTNHQDQEHLAAKEKATPCTSVCKHLPARKRFKYDFISLSNGMLQYAQFHC